MNALQEASTPVASEPEPLTTTGALEHFATAAVRAAALAAAEWTGRGDGKSADGAATQAMRRVLSGISGCGTVVIGEGEKDNAPMLYNGEVVGSGDGPEFDIAVDPVECTDNCATGLPGALATIAFAEKDTMWSPGPAHYMDKLVVGREAREAIDLRDEPERTVQRVAEALGKNVRDLSVVVLDKPRHTELIERVRETGARVSTPSAGDVAGALFALLPGTDIDLLMGTGGTPEGAMSACAVRALGGGMQGRLAPQREDEAEAIRAAGMSTEEILGVDELIGGSAVFAATGISGGDLLRAPWRAGPLVMTESLVVSHGTVRWLVEGTLAADAAV